jgi:chromosome segregation ATPase
VAASHETLAEIDAALVDAQGAVAKLGTALFELDAERDRRRGQLPHLTGSSEAAWEKTGTQLSVLWSWYRALRSTVEAISDRRKATSLRPANLTEIWGLLTTPSVEVPLESRDLARTCLPQSDAVGARAPIALLVRVISAGYEQAAETIASLFAAIDMALPRLDELDRAISTAADQAVSAGLRLPNEVLALRRQLDDLRDRTSRDPLSLDVELIPPLAVAVERLRVDLTEATASLDSVDELFEELAVALDAADAEIRPVKTAVEIATQKIEGAKVGSHDVATLEGTASQLRVQLDQARSGAADDRPGALRAARALESPIAGLRADAGRLLSAATEPIAKRQELRGRLDAYRAKAYSLGQAEDSYLESLYRAAQDVLYTAPCDLSGAERRLAAYQAAVLGSAEEDGLS